MSKKLTMKINAPLALFFTLFLQSQLLLGQTPTGGWGNCEFATVASMNAFDPTGSTYTCKKAYVTATDEHYQWDGSAWALPVGGQNIYNTSGTLTADRTVTLDGNDLTFDGTSDVVIKSTGRVGIGTTTPDAKLDVENGNVRFSDYGGGTITGTPTYYLAVDTNGDVIEATSNSVPAPEVSNIGLTTYTFSGPAQHNWSPSGFTSSPYYKVYRIDTTFDTDLTGINSTGVVDGQRITLLNIGTRTIKLKNDVLSTAANRIYTPGGIPLIIVKGGAVTLIYDATSSRWRTFSHGTF